MTLMLAITVRSILSAFVTFGIIGLHALSNVGVTLGNNGPSRAGANGNAAFDLRTDCGAKGDGESDDTEALRTCLERLNRYALSGGPEALHIPLGLYRISGSGGPLPMLTHGAAITGDGPTATIITLDRTFRGDVLSWSES